MRDFLMMLETLLPEIRSSLSAQISINSLMKNQGEGKSSQMAANNLIVLEACIYCLLYALQPLIEK